MKTCRRHILAVFKIAIFAPILASCTRGPNLIEEPEFAHIANHQFSTSQELFLVNLGHYGLKRPGSESSVPKSVEAYYEHPDDWWEYEEGRPDNYGKVQVIAVIPKGTLVAVDEIRLVRSGWCKGMYESYGRILLPEYRRRRANLTGPFNRIEGPNLVDPSPSYFQVD